jgi:hypothetical protein
MVVVSFLFLWMGALQVCCHMIVVQSPDAGGGYGQRLFSDPSVERQASMRQMLADEVQHVASETWLITRLSLTLLRVLG